MELFNFKAVLGSTSLLLILLTTCSVVSAGKVLNCSAEPNSLSFCRQVCNEEGSLSSSTTKCDVNTGICICDCRDRLGLNCVKIETNDCNRNCKAQPSPSTTSVYEGKMCTVPNPHHFTPNHQCACECTPKI